MTNRSLPLPLLVLAGLCSLAAGCSAVLNAESDQCNIDSDCQFLGEEFECHDAVCEPPDPADRVCPLVDSYTQSDSIVIVRNACELPGSVFGSTLTNGENEVEVISPLAPLPFDVCAYGDLASTLWIGDNGYVAFSDTPPQATQTSVGEAHSLGEPGVPGPGIAAFWDALRVGPAGVCMAVDGVEPNRILWITWDGACFEDGSGVCNEESTSSLTFSVGIEEGTGNFFVGYVSMTGDGALTDRALGQAATIGITNAGARGCPATECDSTGHCTDGSACNYTEHSAQAVLPALPTLKFSPNL